MTDFPTVAADYALYFSQHLSFLVGEAKKHGVPAERILKETSRVLGPIVAGEASDGFATTEDGLQELLTSEGGTVSLTKASRLYKQSGRGSRQALTDQIRKGKVIAYQSSKSCYVVPTWQFRPEGGLLPGLDKVLETLQAHPFYSPVLPFTFMLQEHPMTDLETPLAALRRGKLEKVLAAAAAEGK